MSRLAIDVGGTWLRYELVGEDDVCGKFSSKKEPFLDFIVSMLRRYPHIDAVAVSFAGQVHNGVILSAPNIDVKKPELKDFVETNFSVSLRLENDLNCAALAESVYWNEKEIVALYSGTGVGGGLIVDGKIVHGWRNLAGEIGHIPYKTAPFKCGCGKDNCLELYASGSGIQKWKKYFGLKEETTLQQLKSSKKPDAMKIAESYIEALIYAAATMVTMMNPKILVLGGGVIEHNPELVETVCKRIGDYALLASCEGLIIEKSCIENASLEGAKILLNTIA
ncbi:ROK family protein [Hydrogenimonas thermophila]|uniref:ROK family protein n=1 Tax=Hydrogenimonas thermophila TaxID=223786 RepID=UPI00293713BB|nr:ROK family protein [Hydrogenimonas thermophila]WOE69175.1 ROK family protein [Hydrogenimonas thermophila]WOE71685.1 ROK family protein [Hydrogenimonas thermophila]